METVTINLPSQLAARARSLAEVQRKKLPEFLLVELQRVLNKKEAKWPTRASHLSTKDWHIISDQEIMDLANLRMEKWQALQMHRLIHQAGARQLSSEEQKILDTLLEIHNELGIKKAQAIAEAIRRGLLPPGNDPYWNTPPSKIDAEKGEMITGKIWLQARDDFNWRCAYCQTPAIYLPQELQTEHIVPPSLGGRDTIRNICPACPNCNAHKAKKISAVDPQSGDEMRLFNPRKQKWIEHFEWDKSGTQVIGRTNIGRATVAALKMNLPDIIAWRSIIVGIGGYPPKLD